ncbi:Carbohydrate esterase family 4 protein [Mycena kentingensis (nom. inval.)]|nr:Carbohydrate esterase family 4 protein [Mycena kentingensis (nom. inval.)]
MPALKTILLGAALLSVVAGQTAPTTEEEEAAILDGTQECVAYGLKLVTDALAANQFPPLDPTTPVPDVRNDTAGTQKFQEIEKSIPNIPVKTEGGTYDNAGDPDCYWTETQCVVPKHTGIKPDIAMAPEPRTLGYGFDDGPACDHNVFYNYLSAQKQQATMFYIGKNVIWYPLQAMRAAKDGHEICVHTWSHGYMTQMTNEQAFAELWYTIKAIKLVTGLTPTCWRPPHGDVDDRIRFIAQSLNLDTVMWRFDAFDWENGQNGITPTQIQGFYDKLVGDAKSGALDSNGAIILAHELNNFTMQMAMDNYPKIKDAFDYVVPVAIAMNKTQPYAETSVTLPSFSEFAAANGKSSSSSGPGSSSTGNTNTGSGSGNADAGSSSGNSDTGGNTNTTTAGSTAKGTGAASSLRLSSGASLWLSLLLAAVAWS